MKKLKSLNFKKLLIAIVVLSAILIPVYSLPVNGYVWEIDHESCIGCGTCVDITYTIDLNDEGLAYFPEGTHIGHSSVYLEYNSGHDWFLNEALDMCPVGAIIKSKY